MRHYRPLSNIYEYQWFPSLKSFSDLPKTHRPYWLKMHLFDHFLHILIWKVNHAHVLFWYICAVKILWISIIIIQSQTKFCICLCWIYFKFCLWTSLYKYINYLRTLSNHQTVATFISIIKLWIQGIIYPKHKHNFWKACEFRI